MNARFDTTDATPAPARPGRFAVSRSLARIARPALVLLVCGFAQAQNALGDLIAADARKLLHHADPEVRGEAALIAAHGADHDGLQQLLALAKDPARMARAMKLGAQAGYEAFHAGRMPKRPWAHASSPTGGRIHS